MAKLLQNLPMLEPFVIDSGNLDKRWKIYMNEVNLFLLASGITNDTQKRAVLLHVSGKQVRQVFNAFTDVGTRCMRQTPRTFCTQKEYHL